MKSQAQSQAQAQGSQSSLQATLNTFMQQTGQSLAVNNQAISRLEVKVGKLANRLNEMELRKLLSQLEPNPRGSNLSGKF